MAVHAGMTETTSGTVFNVAGTRVGVHIVPPRSNRSSGSGAVIPSTSAVGISASSESEVRI